MTSTEYLKEAGSASLEIEREVVDAVRDICSAVQERGDDALFEFDPPTDAEVTEPTTADSERFDDHEGAADAVPYELPEPDLPEEYTLAQITVSAWESSTSATLVYEHAGEFLNVNVADHEKSVDEATVVERDVGEVDATVTVVTDRPLVVWECEGLTYRVSGSLEADTLIEVAEAVGC